MNLNAPNTISPSALDPCKVLQLRFRPFQQLPGAASRAHCGPNIGC